MTTTLHLGDCVQVLRTLQDACMDSVVTDPPYELGFMGKGWDAMGIAYHVPMWAEVLRVLKPGGHLLAFGGTRTYHRMACAIEDAGFEIRDSIHWTYGSGFPKSMDVAKAIDKHLGAEREVVGTVAASGYTKANVAQGAQGREVLAWAKTSDVAATPEAAAWTGWGTALKPSHEPVVVARKRLIGTVAENVLAHGVGAVNVDANRIATTENLNGGAYAKESLGRHDGVESWRYKVGGAGDFQQPDGRWPANTILTHAAACVLQGTKKVHSRGQETNVRTGFGDADGFEIVEEWECALGCPVALLDTQSGPRDGCKPHVINASEELRQARRDAGWGSVTMPSNKFAGYDDEGGASRFLNTTSWTKDDTEWVPFLYTPKASRSEREAGLDDLETVSAPERTGRKEGSTGLIMQHPNGSAKANPFAGNTSDHSGPLKNHHPTVKPIAIMRHLIRLVTPIGGTVLDPFMGSGTTGCAALYEKVNFLGVELSEDYYRIAQARVAYHTAETRGLRDQRTLAEFFGST